VISPVPDAKSTLRRQLREAIRAVQPAERLKLSYAACRLLGEQAVWQQAQRVLLFCPLTDELDVWPLVVEAVRTGRRVALPRFRPDAQCYEAAVVEDLQRDVVVGSFGIREPAERCAVQPLNQLDLALVPGLGFDARGRRLGRGKGYYDRLLPEVNGLRCGVAIDCQIVPEVPAEPHDCSVDYILTPTRWLACRARAV
jgi:5-formyltetrahydrofolate cyclo-ligase